MKNLFRFFFIFAVTAGLWVATPTAVLADDDLPSCEELTEIIEGLDMAADYLSEQEGIEEDSRVDKELGKLIAALQLIARIEDEDDLSVAVDTMDDIWNREVSWEEDFSPFKMALDSVIMNIERIHSRDCE
ncbi:hypothetical protein ACQZV8_13635 [Magnetococcales bacterium HHB-1]